MARSEAHLPPAGQGAVVLKATSEKPHLNGTNGTVGGSSVSHTNGAGLSAPETHGQAKTLRVGIVLSGGQAPGVLGPNLHPCL